MMDTLHHDHGQAVSEDVSSTLNNLQIDEAHLPHQFPSGSEEAKASASSILRKLTLHAEQTHQQTWWRCEVQDCGKTEGLKACSGCKQVKYCSKAHQKADWRAHKVQCRASQASPRQPSRHRKPDEPNCPFGACPAPSGNGCMDHRPTAAVFGSCAHVWCGVCMRVTETKTCLVCTAPDISSLPLLPLLARARVMVCTASGFPLQSTDRHQCLRHATDAIARIFAIDAKHPYAHFLQAVMLVRQAPSSPQRAGLTDAVSSVYAALGSTPNHACLHRYLGEALHGLRNVEGAIHAMEHALELNPNYAQARATLEVARDNARNGF